MKKVIRLTVFFAIAVIVSVLIYKINSEDVQKISYPIKYEKYIEKYAEKYDLDIFYVLAIIKAESDFNVKAVSSANAKGLMQLHPETAEAIAKKLGWKDYKEEDLFKPQKNIELGCKHISNLISEFGEIRRDILTAAYNAGSGNVKGWLESGYYDYDNDKFKKVPFDETRNYIKRVNENYEYYKELYGKQYAEEYIFE